MNIMTLYANIVNDQVFGIFEGPDYLELKDLLIVRVDETVSVGDIYRNNGFYKPVRIEPTEEQIADKLKLIRTAADSAVQQHLVSESERTGINFLEPDTEESLAFYEKCTAIPELADAQQALDFINALPKFGV